MMAYGCARHRDRGNAVCPVTVYQSKQEVEAALVDQLQTYVLGEQALTMVIGQIRGEIEAQLPKCREDIAMLEAELASVRAEQKRLAKAVALSDDVPELVAELQQRSARIQNLEAQLIAARRSPAELAALTERVESNVRANMARLRQALVDQGDLREVFRAMFPDGLTFEPARTPDDSRQVWKISGYADFAAVAEGDLVSFGWRPQRDSNPRPGRTTWRRITAASQRSQVVIPVSRPFLSPLVPAELDFLGNRCPIVYSGH
jgi:hypothetical protein